VASEGDRNRQLQAAAKKLYEAAEGDARRLAMLAAQYQAEATRRSGGTLEVLGIVSTTSGLPVVQLNWGENAGQIDVEAARAHAMLILEAAQNAVNDAAILDWAKADMGLETEVAVRMIDALRQHRADRWGQPDLELEFERPAPEEGS
jgi:hypothetical protein